MKRSELSWTKTRGWLATAQLKMPVVVMFKYGASFVGFGGAVTVGLLSFPTTLATWSGAAYLTALLAAGIAPLLNQGAAKLEDAAKGNLSERNSFALTAALALLRDVLAGRHDPARFQDRILKQVVATTAEVAPKAGAKLCACLLVPDGQNLEVIAFSDHRDGRNPSGRIPLAASFGAPEAYAKGKSVHVNDVAASGDASMIGKSYRTILCYPLHDAGRVLGVVSIDSTDPGHFADHLVALDTHVRPFVELLTFSLLPSTRGGTP